MTRDEILNMEAGREMDALIAKHVFQYKNFSVDKPQKSEHGDWMVQPIAFYSDDIEAAWQVVEKLIELEMEPTITIFDGKWICIVGGAGFGREINLPFEDKEYSETAPLAICRAALLAVMA